MSLLLIGSDARLSKRLLNIKHFKYKTSRRDSSNSNLYLDFINVENFKIPNDVSKCLIIGGPVSYGESKNDKKIVSDIHKNKIPLLIKKLLERNIYTIYVSSNMVIGKEKLDRSEFAIPKPNIEYGKMKHLCERQIISLSNMFCHKKLAILRLTKHISYETAPFSNWLKRYEQGLQINAFNDLFFAPLTYENTAKIIDKMLDNLSYGIFHYSGEQDINYYDFCKLVNIELSKLGKKKINLKESNSKEMGVKLEDIGKITKLDMTRSTKILKINPLPLQSTINYFSSKLISI